jgi:hypothetical protein
MNQNQTISGAGSILMGYGLSAVQANQETGLILVGIGAALVLIVAFLQTKGVPVQANG